ncbi:hypothetical protein B9J07_27825 [Sinorhizobium sp. LM21]|uniref:hypothetical protein n=1 Tax=Sinorhizobium sp. LM21 TaxID=1449788 RepID=UPI0005D8DF23|nr:hypothetical protein [Sinorhizobium sp. LM21]AJW30198.1 hypothetical protein pLM21S1_p78 [Sinorhizobium sp. LM21]OWZ90398.1 hypothetical protein B9J07_27825 [Sinorhizobium sp. LM21]
MTTSTTPLPCGCFFQGRELHTDPGCAKHQATEIQVFGMLTDRKTGEGRMAQRGECVEYYDILVRADEDDDGDIPEIEEHENLTEERMTAKVAELEAKYGLSAEEVWGF